MSPAPVAAATPTHAGGVVVRHRADGLPELLLVTSRRHPADWILPRGHVAPGEEPATTAAREVGEEAGVTATVVAALDDTVIEIDGERQHVRWFLLESSAQHETDELREVVWLDAPSALARLTSPASRTVAEHALALLAATADGGL